MPDTATKLDELFEALGEYAGDSKEKQREAGLKMLDNPATKAIAEVLLKKGLGKRTAEAQGKASELEEEVKRLNDELADAKSQIKELESKEPNWERRLKDAEKKWQDKLTEAEGKVLTERQQSLHDKVGIERQKFQAALRIGQEGGVDEDFGQLIPSRYADRFVPDPETRSVKVLEIGEKDSYYDPAEGEPAEQLARDVIAKLPPKARIMGAPEGGGGTGNGAGQVNKSLSQYVDTKARTGGYGNL